MYESIFEIDFYLWNSYQTSMEQPIKILEPLKRMPFTLAVFMRLLVLIPIFGMSILMMVAGFIGILKNNILELPTLLLGIAFFAISSFILVKIFILEKLRISQLQYFFYANRLVIYNKKKSLILYEVFFEQIPEFTFHENLKNFGYIVIGKNEPIMARGGMFGQNIGINMKDPDIMLENLPEVKKEYLFLKELVETYKTTHHKE